MVIRLPPRGQVETPANSQKRKRVVTETIELSSDDESTHAVKAARQPNKRPRSEERASTPKPSQITARNTPKQSGEITTTKAPTRSSSQDTSTSSPQTSADVASTPATTPPSSRNSPSTSSKPSAEFATAKAATPPPSLQDTSRSSPQAPAHVNDAIAQLPTPNATPLKPNELYAIPQLADRYVAKRSTLEGVEETNPQKFCLRPPFHTRLASSEVDKMISHLREQFDPITVSKELDRPVEEIKHLYDALVVNPLYDYQEAIQRQEDGMAQIMASFNVRNEDGSDAQNRPWGEKNEAGNRYGGELSGIETGLIKVIGASSGIVREFKLSQLSIADKKYLQYTLTADESRTLWGSQCRKWGPNKDGRFITGFLCTVEAGLVRITGRDSGLIRDVKVGELSETDKEYLGVELSAEDKKKLWAIGHDEESRDAK